MNETIRDLITAAKSVLGEFKLSDEHSAGSVGAAIRTSKGNIYTGVSIDLACGLGFCAEAAAVAEMLKYRETQIIALVAVAENGILPPCGRCREMIAQLDVRNMDCSVIIDEDHVVTLRQLLPNHWYLGTDS